LVFVTLVRSVLLSGAGMWTSATEDIKHLETWEAALMRQITGSSMLQHRSTDSMRLQLCIGTSITEEVFRASLRLYGHVMRLSSADRALKVEVG